MRFVLNLLIPILTLTVIVLSAYGAGLRLNPTQSMPVGVYRLEPGRLRHGDCVSFSLTGPYRRIARERGYLGTYPRPLLKRIAALPGDRILVTNHGVIVNGRIIPDSRPRPTDRMGRPLPVFPAPPTVPQGKALVLSDHPDGFDGRYFGLVDMARLKRAVPVFIFSKENCDD